MLKEKIKALAKQHFNQILQIRRHLHQYPELSFQEKETSKYIQQQLQQAGIGFKAGFVGTGILASIEGKNPRKKTILLRADMDALPIEEKNEIDYKSLTPGIMHACGHDVHSACALGAAFILNEIKDEWEGTIKIMFQPGEEVLPGGASLMIKEGILENPKVDKALALHVFPGMESGKVGFKSGMYMASTDELYITVNGKGGHAAMPNDYVNPLIIASEMLIEINARFMQSDSLKGTEGENIPTVVAFGKIEGKGATNVVPPKVDIAGTLRTMNESWRENVHSQLHRIVKSYSEKYGIESHLRIANGYPYLVNDVELTNLCTALAKDYLGTENVEELLIRMTAEDFAFITQKIPSCFFRLGTSGKQKTFTDGVHSPTFNIDESALQTGMEMMAWLAVQV